MAERTRGLRQPFSLLPLATTTWTWTWTDDGTSFSKPHSDASEGVSVGLAVGLSCERAGLWLRKGGGWSSVPLANVEREGANTHTQCVACV